MSGAVTTTSDSSSFLAPLSEPSGLDDLDFDEALERAEARFSTLTRSFANLMEVVALMHRDEDWRYLKKEDGGEYASLAEVIAVALRKSPSMARRYVQGARDLYLPLSAIVIDGTEISVDSSDVAGLGVDGAREVVERVAERVNGTDDPYEQSQIISDTVDEVRAEREKRSSSAASDNDNDDDDPNFDYGGNEDRSTVYCGLETDDGQCFKWEGHAGECDSDPDEAGSPPTPLSFSGAIDVADDAGLPSDDGLDPADRIVASGADYSDADTRATLPADLIALVEAIALVAGMDATSFARSVNYETRGIARLLPRATANLTRTRALVETQPWLLSRI